MGLSPVRTCDQCEKSLSRGSYSTGWLCPSSSMCMFCDDCAAAYRYMCPYHTQKLRGA